jgi:hypothetical protein
MGAGFAGKFVASQSFESGAKKIVKETLQMTESALSTGKNNSQYGSNTTYQTPSKTISKVSYS